MTPSVLVFDVNETLVDIDWLSPLFEQLFGDPAVLREWFGQLVAYSMTVTLAGRYVDFFTLAQSVLGMLSMSAHPDVAPAACMMVAAHNTCRNQPFPRRICVTSPANYPSQGVI